MTEIHERLARAQGARALPPHAHGQRAAGPARRARRQARAAAVLEQLPRARRPPARARGGGRRRDALGRRRRGLAAGVGHDDRPPAARGAPGRLQAHERGAAVRLGLPGQHGRRQRAGGQRRGRLLRRAQPRLDHRRLPARAGRDLRLPPRRRRAPRLGPAPGRGPRRADRHRLGLLDGRRRRAAGGDRRARAAPRRARRRRRGARHRLPGPRRPRRRGRGRPRGRGRRRRRHARQGARRLRRLRRAATRRWPSYLVNTRAAAHLLHRAAAAGGGRRARRRSSCWPSSPSASRSCRPTPTSLRDELAREGFEVAGSTTQIVPLVVGDAAAGDARSASWRIERGVFAQAIRPADGARGHVAAAPGGDGLAQQGRAARGRAGARPRRAAGGLAAGRRRAGRRSARRGRREAGGPFDIERRPA